jgi:hypothetical protein
VFYYRPDNRKAGRAGFQNWQAKNEIINWSFGFYAYICRLNLLHIFCFHTQISSVSKFFGQNKWWGQNSVASTGFTIVLRCAYAQASLVRGASSAKNIITVDFCLCGAILNLNAFCFGAIPDIMIELIAYWSVPQSR